MRTPRSPPLPRPWSHLLETGLDKVGLVNEPLLEVIEALVLEAHGLPACQLLSWWELCQERGQVVQLRLHLPQVLLMHHTLLWGVGEWSAGPAGAAETSQPALHQSITAQNQDSNPDSGVGTSGNEASEGASVLSLVPVAIDNSQLCVLHECVSPPEPQHIPNAQ